MDRGYYQGQGYPNYNNSQWQNQQQQQQQNNAQFNNAQYQQPQYPFNYNQQNNVQYQGQENAFPHYNQQPIPPYQVNYPQQQPQQQHQFHQPVPQNQYYNQYQEPLNPYPQQTPYQFDSSSSQPSVPTQQPYRLQQPLSQPVLPPNYHQYQQKYSNTSSPAPQFAPTFQQSSPSSAPQPIPYTEPEVIAIPSPSPPYVAPVPAPVAQQRAPNIKPQVPQHVNTPPKPPQNQTASKVQAPVYSQPKHHQLPPPKVDQTPRQEKRKAEEQLTPLKATVNSSQQPTPSFNAAPMEPKLLSSRGFSFDYSNAKDNKSSPAQTKKSLKDSSQTKAPSQAELVSLLNNDKVRSQQLLDLSDQFYSHAVSQMKNIKTKKNLQEFYTLIQLSISCLEKILEMKNKVSLALRIKCHNKLGFIINNNCNIDQDSSTLEHHYDQVIMLCGNNFVFKHEKCLAQAGIIISLIDTKKYRQALKFVNETIEEWGLENASLLVYFKLQILLLSEPSQALNFLQNYISDNKTTSGITSFFKIIEICLSLYRGMKPMSTLESIDNTDWADSKETSDILLLFTKILVQINHRDLDSSEKLESLFKTAAGSINALDPEKTFTVNFQIPGGDILPIGLEPITCENLNILTCLLYGITLLNSTYEKRKPLKLFDRALGMIDSALFQINDHQKSTTSISNRVLKLNYLKNLTIFYKLMESFIMEPYSSTLVKEYEKSMASIPKYLQESGQLRTLFVLGLQAQLNSDLSRAKNYYNELLRKHEQGENLKNASPDHAGIGNDHFAPKTIYSELYIFSCLNLLLIIESNLHYFTRTGKTNKVVESSNERKEILVKLENITKAKNNSIKEKYLIDTTISFLHLVYNYDNLSILDINVKVSEILNNFEALKRFPLLCSILLYIKSDSLNSNSDQKQKSSQVSFNLAKLGYSPMIRYLSGILNGKNATIARNLQQAEIQSQKLKKIKKGFSHRYDKIHD